jgi:aspartate carbamoyltransferase catalytic subunit
MLPALARPHACLPTHLLPSRQVASDVDVLYQTRIQKERFQDR